MQENIEERYRRIAASDMIMLTIAITGMPENFNFLIAFENL